MQNLYEITIKGKWHKWSFTFWAKDNMVDWEKDGLEVRQVFNTIPVWVVKMGLTNVWCRLQDIKIIPLE
jgi:hypothetical protein